MQTRSRRRLKQSAECGIKSISLADTIGIADAASIQSVVNAALHAAANREIGVHLHSAAS